VNIKVRKELAELIGLKVLERFGLSVAGWTWHNETRELDLAVIAPKRLDELEALFQAQYDKHGAEKARGAAMGVSNIQVWRRAISGAPQKQKARTAFQMANLLKLYLQKVPGHRLYEKRGELWLAYYVDRIIYREKVVQRDRVTPASVEVVLVYEELGGRSTHNVFEYEAECRGRSASEFLARKNFHIESDTLRTLYLEEYETFTKLQPQVGLQLETFGTGTDDLDGNADDDDGRRWYRYNINTYALGTVAEPGRAVVDVFHEKTQSDSDRDDKVHLDPVFWRQKSVKTDDDDFEVDDGFLPEVPPEIPVHPFLAIFDLTRHLRLRVHVSNVDVHVYDKQLAEKLVLPAHLKALVSLLIEHRAGGFQDIVKGKAGGAVVLLAGAPGTGKTLTAEVYAEAEGRALYSVQCSQLGVKPEDLEEELLKCFARCGRWNAVMLLDEADVYVHTRGDDLHQNAIVGVFLRVLEYQSAVLFLTTNRAEDVDDAIASRCIARLNYTVPSATDQAKIWRILADMSGATLTDATIAGIARRNPALSGRDVKNLLKLAMLMSKGQAITEQEIEFVKQFKPTETKA